MEIGDFVYLYNTKSINMKTKLILLFVIIFITITSKGQTPNPRNGEEVKQGFNVILSPNPSIDKFTLTIHSEKISLNNCHFKMINEKGKTVKTIDLPKANNDLETTINIKDIELGGYWCVVTKENKELFKGRFVKDLVISEDSMKEKNE